MTDDVKDFYATTPEILALSKLNEKNSYIDPELYIKLDVKRGLRDLAGKGVLTGLTKISDVRAHIYKAMNRSRPTASCFTAAIM